MSKVRLRATITVEYEVDPNDYDGAHPESIALIDEENVDPIEFVMDHCPKLIVEVVE
jgi:hypothetical protein